VSEAGVREYEAGSWYGILAPAGTPTAIIERLNREIVAAMKSPRIQERLVGEAVIPVGGSPDEFSAHIRKELARMARVVKESGARFE
jgi:tripartite-type tricarboxylate transporter receptor subunit TctC